MKVLRQGVEEIEVSNGTLLDAEMTAHWPQGIGVFPKLGVPFGGPYNKDYKILGSILGSPYLGKLPLGFGV